LPGVETSEHEDLAGRDAAVIGVVIPGLLGETLRIAPE
jgi:hypothetical protein